MITLNNPRPRPRFRGVWERTKDAAADARVRLSVVKEKHGAAALDVIQATATGFKTTVGDLYGRSLVELARAVHGHGRLRKSGEVWVVYAN